MTKEELKQFNKELDEHEEKIKQPASKLEGKLRRAENLNYQDAKLIKEYGDRIAELEKVNAELKERLKEHESIGNAQFWENVWSWKTKAEQLTKAKEIITELLKYTDTEAVEMIKEANKAFEKYLIDKE